MKLRPALRTLALATLLVPMPFGAMRAQTAASLSPSPAVSPAAKPEKPERSAQEKAARKAERLRKYDTNHDGKLDEKELAAMRADKAKASPTP